MQLDPRLTPVSALRWVGLTLLVLTLLLLLLAYSGLYSVAASSGHFVAVEKFLESAMQRSVKTWSLSVPTRPENLQEPARIKLGASHFSGGCANCHGAPGVNQSAVHERMLPPPSRLPHVLDLWTPEQLFWIVSNGIKYTGMPSWSGHARDDEVWSVVAFLLQLPDMNEEKYLRYAAGNNRFQNTSTPSAGSTDYTQDLLATCDRCHDTDDAPPASSLTPRLAGQRQSYLLRSLREYFSDKRQSGIMEPVATRLKEQDFKKLARYYSNLRSPRYQQTTPADSTQLERGRTLAQYGDVSRRIPPCDVCHTHNGRSTYPLLAAQSQHYIEIQLTVWKSGGRAQTAPGRLMSFIAKRLTIRQIQDVAAYYQQQLPANSARASL